MSLNRWMVKQIVVYPQHGTLHINFKKSTDIHINLDESQGHYAKWWKIGECHISCDSIYLKFSKRRNYKEAEQISICQGL